MKQKLWTRDFTLLTVATVLGAAGGIASSFAMSFLVFDETGSTLAAALLLALELVPQFVIPLVASPCLDRLPRKPFLVAGDALNGVLYAAAGIYLLLRPFTYTGYLLFSLLISCLGAFDSMAYNALYPLLIPQGCEQKGYTVCGMVYPTMQVIMAPVAAVMYEKMGVGWMLALQGILSLLAAGVESGVGVKEQRRLEKTRFSIKLWAGDLKEAWRYLKRAEGAGGDIRIHGRHQRRMQRVRAADHRLFPHGSGIFAGDVFAVFCGGICRAHPGRRGALQNSHSREKALWVRLSGLSGV